MTTNRRPPSLESRRGALRVSVIIPALNEAGRIDACLRSVDARSADVETLVIDGGSDDGTSELAARHAQVVNVGRIGRGRAVQMNAGASLATGDVLLFLHADSELPAGWLEALRQALADDRVVGGTYTLRFDVESPMLRLYAYCTRFRWRLFHYGDQGIFVRAATFRALGGYAPLPLMEDVDFLACLRRAGDTVLIALPVTTSARRFARFGVVRQQLLNAVLMTLFLAGVSPTRLARWYDQRHR